MRMPRANTRGGRGVDDVARPFQGRLHAGLKGPPYIRGPRYIRYS
jgi:hypothetical protein